MCMGKWKNIKYIKELLWQQLNQIILNVNQFALDINGYVIIVLKI